MVRPWTATVRKTRRDAEKTTEDDQWRWWGDGWWWRRIWDIRSWCSMREERMSSNKRETTAMTSMWKKVEQWTTSTAARAENSGLRERDGSDFGYTWENKISFFLAWQEWCFNYKICHLEWYKGSIVTYGGQCIRNIFSYRNQTKNKYMSQFFIF